MPVHAQPAPHGRCPARDSVAAGADGLGNLARRDPAPLARFPVPDVPLGRAPLDPDGRWGGIGAIRAHGAVQHTTAAVAAFPTAVALAPRRGAVALPVIVGPRPPIVVMLPGAV